MGLFYTYIGHFSHIQVSLAYEVKVSIKISFLIYTCLIYIDLFTHT